MSPKREYLEYDGRCQAVIGDHQFELPACHRSDHREASDLRPFAFPLDFNFTI